MIDFKPDNKRCRQVAASMWSYLSTTVAVRSTPAEFGRKNS